MRFLSVCSGIEAASVAWSPLGWKAVAFSEIEPFPCAVLAHHYPDTPNWGDMTKYKEWPDVPIDLLCGGTPCQSFSAIESKGVGAPIIGVQFHPEVGAVGLPESKTLYTRSSEDKEKNLSIIRFFVKAGEQYHAAKILRTELMQFKVLAQINAHGIDITPTIKPSDILKAQGNQKTNTNQPNAKVKKSHNILVSFLHAIYKLLKFISIKIGAIFGEVIRSISSRGLVAIQQQKPPTSPVAKLSVSPPYRILSETPAKLWTDTAPHTAEIKPDSVAHTLSSPSPK